MDRFAAGETILLSRWCYEHVIRRLRRFRRMALGTAEAISAVRRRLHHWFAQPIHPPVGSRRRSNPPSRNSISNLEVAPCVRVVFVGKDRREWRETLLAVL